MSQQLGPGDMDMNGEQISFCKTEGVWQYLLHSNARVSVAHRDSITCGLELSDPEHTECQFYHGHNTAVSSLKMLADLCV